jgi:trans-2,3-dihydro-3-hydroxyanthranilate isomerase
MRVPFVTADVFAQHRFGGNRLAVFPDARDIAPEDFQLIAREFNYSETTFALPPDNPSHVARVRIFSPKTEMPFAGHPSIGTAYSLARLGAIRLTRDEERVVFEEGAGPVPVTIHAKNSEPQLIQLTAPKRPEIASGAPDPDLARVLRWGDPA